MKEQQIIHINDFDGPLDLLLHLIKTNKYDIYDIPINEITQQYMDYIYKMNELDIEVASEFIVMAATLIQIKTRQLLPEDENTDEIIDAKEELIKKMVEYNIFKQISAYMKIKESDYEKLISKDPEYLPDLTGKEVSVSKIDTELLAKAFRSVLTRHNVLIKETTTPLVIQTESYSTKDKMLEIVMLFEKKEKVSFFSLFEKNSSKALIITTFLAVLELFKEGILKIKQEEFNGDITLTKEKN